jgi:hypothetical protein
VAWVEQHKEEGREDKWREATEKEEGTGSEENRRIRVVTRGYGTIGN